MTYDFNDPKIRSMVNYHCPTELFFSNQRPSTGPVCDTCHQNWPCPSIQELREWEREQEMYRRSGPA